MLCLPPWHSTANRQIVAKSPRSYNQTALAPFRISERADTGFAGSTPSYHCRHSPCEVCPTRGAHRCRSGRLQHSRPLCWPNWRTPLISEKPDIDCKSRLTPRHADPGPLFRALHSLVRARGSRGVAFMHQVRSLGRASAATASADSSTTAPRARLGQIRSGTMSMAPQGHSCAQMPQPLQKS